MLDDYGLAWAENQYDRQEPSANEVEDEMREVVECPICHNPEYYGMMYWRNGQQMCRSCIYSAWHEDSGWNPSPTDYTFPLYEGPNPFKNESEEK